MFGDRLKNLREQRGFTQKQMLDKINNALIESSSGGEASQISLSTYRNWEQNVAVPNSKYLRVIAPLLHTTTDYLLNVKHEKSDYKKSKLMLTYEQLNDEGQSIILNTAEGLQASGKYNRPEAEYESVEEYMPFYTIGKAAAGSGYGNQDLIESYRLIMTTEVPKHDFTLDVVGNSMFPSIIDGDVVFVRKECDKLDNKIYVLDIDGDTIIKRVVFDQNKITLISDNPDWDDREITGNQLKRVRVEGIVVGWETPER